MTKQNPPSWVKPTLELGPVLLFFLGYLWLKDSEFLIFGREYGGFVLVTALFVPVMLAATWGLKQVTGKVSRMQVFTLVVVVIFGLLTVIFNDERFLKIKPTIVNATFGAILGFGLLRGQSYLRLLMEELIPMSADGWMVLTRRFCILFFILAIANEIVWRLFSTQTWIYFETFGMPAAMFVFFMLQAGLFQKHGTMDDDAP